MKPKKQILKELLELGKLLLLALVVSLFIRENVVASGYVPTGSMEDTVMKESRILINRLSYIWEDPQRGDIVAFHYPDNPNEIYLKFHDGRQSQQLLRLPLLEKSICRGRADFRESKSRILSRTEMLRLVIDAHDSKTLKLSEV